MSQIIPTIDQLERQDRKEIAEITAKIKSLKYDLANLEFKRANRISSIKRQGKKRKNSADDLRSYVKAITNAQHGGGSLCYH